MTSKRRGSALATAVFLTFFGAGFWVLAMCGVLGSQHEVCGPARLASVAAAASPLVR